MFDIEYLGGNSVVFSTKKSKLIMDPKLSLVGLKDVEPKGMVAVATEERFAVHSSASVLEIEGPGEYEVGDFSVKGIPAKRHIDTEGHKSTIYKIEIGEVRIAVLGNVDPKLSEDQLEGMGVVDMVIIPVGGGGYTLDATSAAHAVRAIDAKVVVPIHYADPGLKYEVPQDELSVFEKEFGGTTETVDKLKVKAASSLPLVPTIYKLNRS